MYKHMYIHVQSFNCYDLSSLAREIKEGRRLCQDDLYKRHTECIPQCAN